MIASIEEREKSVAPSMRSIQYISDRKCYRETKRMRLSGATRASRWFFPPQPSQHANRTDVVENL